jgi:hypothetical protein
MPNQVPYVAELQLTAGTIRRCIFDPDKIVIFGTIIGGKISLPYIYRGDLS